MNQKMMENPDINVLPNQLLQHVQEPLLPPPTYLHVQVHGLPPSLQAPELLPQKFLHVEVHGIPPSLQTPSLHLHVRELVLVYQLLHGLLHVMRLPLRRRRHQPLRRHHQHLRLRLSLLFTMINKV